MNNVSLMGRLTRDPEIKCTQSNIAVAQFTLAVDRKKFKDREQETDFITCKAWRTQADFAGKYLHKGMRVALVGSIQTRSYDGQDGKRVYVTEVVAESIYFADGKAGANDAPAQGNQRGGTQNQQQPNADDSYLGYGYNGDDEDLPF